MRVELLPNEIIESTIRRHWFNVGIKAFSFVLFAIAPLVVYFAFLFLDVLVLHPSITYLLVIIYALWIIILILAFAVFYTDYYLDAWFITNKRLIDVEQNGLFARSISTASLENVQDVTVKVTGVLATWLKFGDVIVQTAGSDREFIIKQVKNPEKVKEMVMQRLSRVPESTVQAPNPPTPPPQETSLPTA